MEPTVECDDETELPPHHIGGGSRHGESNRLLVALSDLVRVGRRPSRAGITMDRGTVTADDGSETNKTDRSVCPIAQLSRPLSHGR